MKKPFYNFTKINIPIKQPIKKTKWYYSKLLSALIINVYAPNITKINDPEIPGNIIAEDAIIPQIKI